MTDAEQRRTRFMALDGIRGLSAICVTLFHIQLLSTNLMGHVPRQFAMNSYLFVDFFFVLSGFVIAGAYRDRMATPSQVGQFALRRLFRLWPLHCAMLIGLILIELIRMHFFTQGADAAGAPFGPREQPATILANLLLVQSLGLFSINTWNVPSWSISAEFWTYAVFAVTCAFAPGRRTLVWVTLALLGCAVLMHGSTSFMDATFDYGFFRCLFGFFTGTLVFELFQRSTPWISRSRVAAVLLTLAEAPVMAVALGFVAIVGASSATYAAPAIFAVVIYVFASGLGPVSWLLLRSPVQWLGRVSYSIYMVQWIVLICMGLAVHTGQRLGLLPAEAAVYERVTPFAGDAFVALYFAVICAASAVTWRLIEQPPQRWLAARLRASRTTRIALS